MAACGVVVTGMPGAASGQQRSATLPRIGFLSSEKALRVAEFRAGLEELGYIQGKTIVVEYRFAEGRYDKLTEMARELVQLPVRLIVAAGTPATRAAQQATKTIPIVFLGSGDPVATGLVKSLARPGGNITSPLRPAEAAGRDWLAFLRIARTQRAFVCRIQGIAR